MNHEWKELGDLPSYGYRCVKCGAVVSRTPNIGEWSGPCPGEAPKSAGPLDRQVGGDHYKKLAIQPVEYITKNKIPYLEGNVIKYVTRWRDKGGTADLEKAKHYIDMIIQMEGEQL